MYSLYAFADVSVVHGSLPLLSMCSAISGTNDCKVSLLNDAHSLMDTLSGFRVRIQAI